MPSKASVFNDGSDAVSLDTNHRVISFTQASGNWLVEPGMSFVSTVYTFICSGLPVQDTGAGICAVTSSLEWQRGQLLHLLPVHVCESTGLIVVMLFLKSHGPRHCDTAVERTQSFSV